MGLIEMLINRLIKTVEKLDSITEVYRNVDKSIQYISKKVA